MTLTPTLRRLLPFALLAAGVAAVAAVALLRSGSEQSGPEAERPVARLTPTAAPAGEPLSSSTPGAPTENAPPVQARDRLASTTIGDFELVSVAPYDAIPAIFDPTFVSAAEADEQLLPRDLVLGVSVAGDHRAYGVAFLADHEVVNDVIGGVPLAVTW